MMKSFQTTLRWAVPLMLVLVWTGCDSNTALDEPALKHSGEEIFRGLIFGQGPVADLFPELWSKQAIDEVLAEFDPETRAQYVLDREKAYAQYDALVAEIRTQDPGFFDRFGAAMKSGDHLRVEAALKESQEQVIAGAAAQQGVTVDDVKRAMHELAPDYAGDPNALLCGAINVALVINVAVVVNVVAQVNLWLQGNVQVQLNLHYEVNIGRVDPTHQKYTESRFGQDVYIDMLTQRLSQ